MSNWILTMKILLVSTGVVSLAMAMKLTVPFLMNFALYELPTLWSALASLFKPPYLYVVINAIILTIVASTRFTQNDSPSSDDQFQPLITARTPPPVEFSDVIAVDAPVLEEVAEVEVVKVTAYEDDAFEVEKSEVEVNVLEAVEIEEQVIENEEEVVVSRSTYTAPETIIPQEIVTETATVMERPLALSRFGHRKPLKASPEGGKPLRVARPKRQETLESTWRTITEGRHVPLTRHLKKIETWENNGRHVNVTTTDDNGSSIENSQVQKSKTFKDHTNNIRDLPVNPRKIRKEPSLSQDELNRRVEAFIKKFNEEMRLQRQESLQKYTEMMNRGA